MKFRCVWVQSFSGRHVKKKLITAVGHSTVWPECTNFFENDAAGVFPDFCSSYNVESNRTLWGAVRAIDPRYYIPCEVHYHGGNILLVSNPHEISLGGRRYDHCSCCPSSTLLKRTHALQCKKHIYTGILR